MDDAIPDRLEHTEEQLRPLIENATDVVTVLNRDGTRRYVSPAIERSLGYKPEELVGQNAFDLVHPDDLPDLQRAFASGLLKPDIVVTKQFRLKAKDGSWRIHEATAHNLLNDPTVHGVVINSRDITERKRLERRLAAQYEATRILSEAPSLNEAAPKLLRAICESLNWDLGQLWIVDHQADKLVWLASWHPPAVNADEFEEASRSRLFSSGAGLPGRVWAGAAPLWISEISEDETFQRGAFAAKAKLFSAFAVPLMLGDEVSGVMEFFTREHLPIDPSLLEVIAAIGKQVGQFVERKHAEAERSSLFEREQRARLELEATMTRMRQVQVVTEIALAHLSLDKLLAELIDRVREAMDVDTVVILLMEDDHHLVAWAAKGLELDLKIRVPMGAGFAGRVAERKAPMVIDDIDQADLYTPFLREHGVKSLLGVPLLIEGRAIGVIHVGRMQRRPFIEDDTRLLELVAFRVALAIDNARLFEEERAARREAEAASRAKDEFLTTISHELRTPLTPIIGWIHMIRNGLLPQNETTHGLEVIDKNSQSLKRLINDLLDMSAILSGKMRIEESPVRLADALREAVDTVRTLAATREITLEFNPRNLHNESVTGDRTRLIQAFVNVLDNAIKFSTPQGIVKVTCEPNGEHAVIRISDAGRGIAPEFLPFVFDRFRQEDGSKTRSHGGLGLGLALVKSFIESHKGTVQAESGGPGKGSRFTIRLPLRRDAAASAPGEQQTHLSSTTPKPAHLMIIEDDSDTLEMLSATLKRHGFQVTAYESAAEALQQAPLNAVDLIISDIGMPELDGFEMIKQLRSLAGYESIPAIALSGYAAPKDVKTALASGFDAHVSKPVEPSELTTIVNKLLKKGGRAERDSGKLRGIHSKE